MSFNRYYRTAHLNWKDLAVICPNSKKLKHHSRVFHMMMPLHSSMTMASMTFNGETISGPHTKQRLLKATICQYLSRITQSASNRSICNHILNGMTSFYVRT